MLTRGRLDPRIHTARMVPITASPLIEQPVAKARRLRSIDHDMAPVGHGSPPTGLLEVGPRPVSKG